MRGLSLVPPRIRWCRPIVRVHSSHDGPGERPAVLVGRRADRGVEGGDAAHHRRHDLRLPLDKVIEDETEVLVDQEDDVSEAGGRHDHLLEVEMQYAWLGRGRRQRA